MSSRASAKRVSTKRTSTKTKSVAEILSHKAQLASLKLKAAYQESLHLIKTNDTETFDKLLAGLATNEGHLRAALVLAKSVRVKSEGMTKNAHTKIVKVLEAQLDAIHDQREGLQLLKVNAERVEREQRQQADAAHRDVEKMSRA